MIELYGMSSPNVVKITIMLHEVGLPYEMHHVGVFEGQQFTPSFKALNPNSKVPVIVDHASIQGGRHTVFESGAILLYLAEKTGVGLAKDPLARSRQIQWLMIQLTGIGPMCGQLTHFSRYAPEGNDYSLARYRSEVRRLLQVLDDRLTEHEYLSDGYSIADIAIVPWIRLLSTMYPWLQESAEGPALREYPSLRRWLQVVTARPAVIAGIEAGERFLPNDIEMFKKAGADQFDRFFGRGKYLRS
jgi:GST-like protein